MNLNGSKRDVEKGFQTIDMRMERGSEESNSRILVGNNATGKQTQGPKKTKPTIAVPSSHFEMDSPQSPMWQRVFGRK